jgi:hypothetical protein
MKIELMKTKSSPRSVLSVISMSVMACVFLGTAWQAFQSVVRRAGLRAVEYTSQACIRRPSICAHRIVGDEVDVLGADPLDAMDRLFSKDVQCFDGDVVRYVSVSSAQVISHRVRTVHIWCLPSGLHGI